MNDEPPMLKIIEEFVCSVVQPKEFEQLLTRSPLLEDFLKRQSPIPPYSTSPARNLYQFLIETDYSSPRSVLNAQDGLSKLLRRYSIFIPPRNAHVKQFDILKSIQPKWLDISETYGQALLDEAGVRQGSELKNWLKSEIHRRFRYISRPPKWLQSPRWPEQEGIPLVFLGQVATGNLLHDDAQVYIFMHPASMEIMTIVQSA
ncbi:hypothetical protein [Deinococcus sp.]|uniref:hypothetical protein n=1 Tax=Deinococcus sp. TaxID=47478 RepID=UPI003C79E62D